MAERTLIARVHADPQEDRIVHVAAPAVGVVDLRGDLGMFLNRFERIGLMRILGERYVIRLPRDVQGRVARVHLPDSRTAVAFDAPLLVLDQAPEVPDVARALDPESRSLGTGVREATEELITVRAPSEGTFYRRPGPDAPAFVEPGSRVRTGSVLGLVEVMKCFNHIVYGGVGLPDSAVVVEVLLEDAAEIGFGQPLFLVRPTGA